MHPGAMAAPKDSCASGCIESAGSHTTICPHRTHLLGALCTSRDFALAGPRSAPARALLLAMGGARGTHTHCRIGTPGVASTGGKARPSHIARCHAPFCFTWNIDRTRSIRGRPNTRLPLTVRTRGLPRLSKTCDRPLPGSQRIPVVRRTRQTFSRHNPSKTGGTQGRGPAGRRQVRVSACAAAWRGPGVGW